MKRKYLSNQHKPVKRPKQNANLAISISFDDTKENVSLAKVASQQVSSNPHTNNSFLGSYKDSYQKLYSHIIHNNVDYKNLSGTDKNNSKYFFHESITSDSAAREFLNAFWSEFKNVEATIKSHNEKATKKNSPNPRCISFTTAKLSEKHYCFITVSGAVTSYSDLFESLINTTQHLNQANKSCEFVITNCYGGNSAKLSKYISDGIVDIKKGCSEKKIVALLTKIFLQTGSALEITGSTNCDLYPFNVHNQYSADHFVRLSKDFDRLEISENHFVSKKPCCTACQVSKTPSLTILEAAKEFADQNREPLPTTPLSEHIFGDDSLLNNIAAIRLFNYFSSHHSRNEKATLDHSNVDTTSPYAYGFNEDMFNTTIVTPETEFKPEPIIEAKYDNNDFSYGFDENAFYNTVMTPEVEFGPTPMTPEMEHSGYASDITYSPVTPYSSDRDDDVFLDSNEAQEDIMLFGVKISGSQIDEMQKNETAISNNSFVLFQANSPQLTTQTVATILPPKKRYVR